MELWCLMLILVVSVTISTQTNNQPAILEDLRRASPSRIVAGWPARPGQIPHQVSLRQVSWTGRVDPCGGSVIHHHWILTAAHCLANCYTFVIRIGSADLTAPGMMIESTKRYLHPNYIEETLFLYTEDIALIQVDEFIPYGEFIKPCRIMSSEQLNIDYTGVVFTASGYGLTDDTWNGGELSDTLNWVYLRGISNEECKSWYPSTNVIDAATICAESYNDTRQSSCQGDSGGPMTIVDFDGNPTLVGISSFGSSSGCNSPWPSGWVRPGHFHAWFRQVTGINFDWTRQGVALSAPAQGYGD